MLFWGGHDTRKRYSGAAAAYHAATYLTSVNGLIHLGHVALHLVQPGEEGFADTFSVDGFVVMGEEIAKTGASCKRVRELWLQDAVMAKDIEGLGIGLRRA
ncbi:MAG: hypothetical protein V5B78_10015 [Desulfohalobiaceae bacterium]